MISKLYTKSLFLFSSRVLSMYVLDELSMPNVYRGTLCTVLKIVNKTMYTICPTCTELPRAGAAPRRRRVAGRLRAAHSLLGELSVAMPSYTKYFIAYIKSCNKVH